MANVHVDELDRAFFSSFLDADADRVLSDADLWDACDAVCKALDERSAGRVFDTTAAASGRLGSLPLDSYASASMETTPYALWVDGATGLTVTAAAKVFGGARGLTLGDVALAADAMAAAMGGEVLEFSMYENDGATVCAYTVGFEHDGEPCVGTVGFVPAADGTVSVLMTTYGAEDAAWAAPLLNTCCGAYLAAA